MPSVYESLFGCCDVCVADIFIVQAAQAAIPERKPLHAAFVLPAHTTQTSGVQGWLVVLTALQVTG